jgi:hypothetical protein
MPMEKLKGSFWRDILATMLKQIKNTPNTLPPPTPVSPMISRITSPANVTY